MGTTIDATKSPGVKLHEGTYTHANLPTTAEKAKLPYLDNVTSDIQNQINGMGGGFDPSFGAGLYLPLTEDPTSATLIENQGHFGANANFTRIGSWTKTSVSEVNGVGGGQYWTKGDANNGGLRHQPLVDINTATAAYVSHNANNGSASIVIDDTANDLEALFEHTGRLNASNQALQRRKFKIVMRSTSTGNKAMAGYIGGISKAGNRYTIDVYSTSDGGVRNWNATVTLGTVSYWGIYRACFDYDISTVSQYEGISVACFYYPSDPTADNIYLASMWDGFVVDQRCLQYAMYQAATNYLFELGQMNNAGGQEASWNIECLTQNRWIALGMTIADTTANNTAKRSININGEQVKAGAPTIGPGMVNVSSLAWCMSPILDTTVFPNGSRIAYPTFWRGVIPQATFNAWYHYHKNKLGLADNH